MTPEDWGSGFGRSIGVFLNGDGIGGRDPRGERITDRHFIVFFNAHDEIVEFTIPSDEYSPVWEIVVDTAGAAADSELRVAGSAVGVEAKSLIVLRAHVEPEVEVDHSVAASLAVLVNSTADDAPSAHPEV
jgi:isoamylase